MKYKTKQNKIRLKQTTQNQKECRRMFMSSFSIIITFTTKSSTLLNDIEIKFKTLTNKLCCCQHITIWPSSQPLGLLIYLFIEIKIVFRNLISACKV
jgi:hypothetical protein